MLDDDVVVCSIVLGLDDSVLGTVELESIPDGIWLVGLVTVPNPESMSELAMRLELDEGGIASGVVDGSTKLLD